MQAIPIMYIEQDSSADFMIINNNTPFFVDRSQSTRSLKTSMPRNACSSIVYPNDVDRLAGWVLRLARKTYLP